MSAKSKNPYLRIHASREDFGEKHVFELGSVLGLCRRLFPILKWLDSRGRRSGRCSGLNRCLLYRGRVVYRSGLVNWCVGGRVATSPRCTNICNPC